MVETTNFKPGASATNTGVGGSPPGNRFPISEEMKMTERFTRLNNDLFDLHDYGGRSRGAHTFLDRAFSAQARQQLPDFEYACTEDNSMIPHWIRLRALSERRTLGPPPRNNINENPGRGGRLGGACRRFSVRTWPRFRILLRPATEWYRASRWVRASAPSKGFHLRPARGRIALEKNRSREPWKGVLKADKFGEVCVQPPRPSEFRITSRWICRIRPR